MNSYIHVGGFGYVCCRTYMYACYGELSVLAKLGISVDTENLVINIML